MQLERAAGALPPVQRRVLGDRTLVTPAGPAGELSALALDQVVCTASTGQDQVSLFGLDRAPMVCPIQD